jgi:hypothetical protein
MLYKTNRPGREYKNLPSPPSSFFSSLTPEQQKQFISLIGKYRQYYNEYYNYKWELFTKSGFIIFLWEHKLYDDIILATGMNKNMWRMLILIWSINKSKKYKGGLTRPELLGLLKTMGDIKNLRPIQNITYLKKHGYLIKDRNKRGKLAYVLTEKATVLLHNLSLCMNNLYDSFFSELT